jgi:glycerol-3-phosphate cytidylyltransferase
VITGVIAGSFDVIHPGYVYTFKKAKNNCDFLTVALQDNPNFERKNKLKCILSLQERIDVLSSIKYIDNIIVYNTENELSELLRSNNFDVRILGDDYINKPITGNEFCKKTVFIDREHNWSTTKFKKLIYQSYKDFINEKNVINSV